MSGRARPLSGVILAGGENRRMQGRPKALLTLGGQTFLHRQLAVQSEICHELLLVLQPGSALEGELGAWAGRVRVVHDLQPGKGPLAGMQAALREARGETLWVVGCDMPCLSAPAAQLLAERMVQGNAEAAIACIDGRSHPLHGVYRRSALPALEAQLAAGDYRLMGWLDKLTVERVEETEFEAHGLRTDFVRNVNDPNDYVILLSEYT